MNSIFAKCKLSFLLASLIYLPFTISANEPSDPSSWEQFWFEEPNFEDDCDECDEPNLDTGSSIPNINLNDYSIVDITNLTFDQFENDFTGDENSTIIVKCSEGSNFIFEYDIDCSYFHFGDIHGNMRSISMTIDQTFYVVTQWINEETGYITQNLDEGDFYQQLFFSSDLETWVTDEQFFGFRVRLDTAKIEPSTLYFKVVKDFSPLDSSS